MYIKRTCLILLLFITLLNLKAQNLIFNADFEIHSNECPEGFISNKPIDGMMPVCDGWYSYGTADYFDTCSKRNSVSYLNANPYYNFAGFQNPEFGSSYVGLCGSSNTTPGFTEILFTKLKSPLEKGKKYCFGMNFSLADSSGFVNKRIRVSISNELQWDTQEVEYPVSLIYFNKEPLVDVKTIGEEVMKFKLENYSSWSETKLEFEAEGGEQWLYINYNKDMANIRNGEFKKALILGGVSYYYFDNIFLEEKMGTCPCYRRPLENTLNEISVFSSIFFDLNESILTIESKVLMDSLIEELKIDNRKVWIKGYTDLTGEKRYNLKLSEKRANTVKEYFISNGVDKTRVHSKGMGNYDVDSKESMKSAEQRRVDIFLSHSSSFKHSVNEED